MSFWNRLAAAFSRVRTVPPPPAPDPVPEPTAPAKLPRGVRNHNPGNLRHGDQWVGLAPEQRDPAFCTFTGDVFGLRALMLVLLAYYRRHKLDTVREIIGRWAPPVENDTVAYVDQVAKRLGIGPDDVLNPERRETLINLARAIVRHENGKPPASYPPDWYDAATYDRAADMALKGSV